MRAEIHIDPSGEEEYPLVVLIPESEGDKLSLDLLKTSEGFSIAFQEDEDDEVPM